MYNLYVKVDSETSYTKANVQSTGTKCIYSTSTHDVKCGLCSYVLA